MPKKVSIMPVFLLTESKQWFIVYTKYEERKEEVMQAYCVKCRAKREMKNSKAITMKNGKPATQGVCPDCGTKMFRIGKKPPFVFNKIHKRLDVLGDVQPFAFWVLK